jgi:hypothetical protein
VAIVPCAARSLQQAVRLAAVSTLGGAEVRVRNSRMETMNPRTQTAEPVAIRLATPTDVAGLMALESRYYIGNLDPGQRSAGFVSVLHSQDWFEQTIADGGLHVAVIDDTVAGFIAVTAPPARNTPDLSALTAAMLDLAETVEFEGTLIAGRRYALRGPVCIGEHARGRGIYTAFNTVTARANRNRFELAVLFVSADNPRSLHTTTTKLGATPLAQFELDGKAYHFLAYSFSSVPDGDVASERLS